MQNSLVVSGYGLSLYRAGVPLLDGLRHGDRIGLRVPEHGIDGTYIWGDPTLDALFHRLVGIVPAAVVLSDGAKRETALIGPAFWSHDARARLAVAAYASQRDPEIEAMSFDPPDFRPEAESEAPLAWAFRQLMGQFQPFYSRPEKIDLPHGGTAQRVLSPSEITLRRTATCLDLSLLMVSLLESIGQHPLVIFTGEFGSAPEHAFVGLWLDPPDASASPILHSRELKSGFESRRFFVMEATELCRGRDRDTAEASAKAIALMDRGPCHAVDVRLARQIVRPLRLDYDPTVARILGLVREFEESRLILRRESLLLFYGLLVGGGEKATRAFPVSAAASIREQIESRDFQRRLPGQEVRVTTGYRNVLRTAEHLARSAHASHVREVDLMRAILESAGFGSRTRRYLEAAGVSMMEILTNILADYPEDDHSSTWVPR